MLKADCACTEMTVLSIVKYIHVLYNTKTLKNKRKRYHNSLAVSV